MTSVWSGKCAGVKLDDSNACLSRLLSDWKSFSPRPSGRPRFKTRVGKGRISTTPAERAGRSVLPMSVPLDTHALFKP